MYLYLVLFVGLIALLFLAVLFSTVMGNVQESFNPQLESSTWVTEDHYNVFYLASTTLTNIWTYIYAFIFFGLVYFAYLYTQRRGV